MIKLVKLLKCSCMFLQDSFDGKPYLYTDERCMQYVTGLTVILLILCSVFSSLACTVDKVLDIQYCAFSTIHLVLYIQYCIYSTVYFVLHIKYCTCGTVHMYCTFCTAHTVLQVQYSHIVLYMQYCTYIVLQIQFCTYNRRQPQPSGCTLDCLPTGGAIDPAPGA